MPCADPVVGSILGAAVGLLMAAGAIAGWRVAGWLLQRLSRRVRAHLVTGEIDQGVR